MDSTLQCQHWQKNMRTGLQMRYNNHQSGKSRSVSNQHKNHESCHHLALDLNLDLNCHDWSLTLPMLLNMPEPSACFRRCKEQYSKIKPGNLHHSGHHAHGVRDGTSLFIFSGCYNKLAQVVASDLGTRKRRFQEPADLPAGERFLLGHGHWVLQASLVLGEGSRGFSQAFHQHRSHS